MQELVKEMKTESDWVEQIDNKMLEKQWRDSYGLVSRIAKGMSC